MTTQRYIPAATPWAIRVLHGALYDAHAASAEEDAVTVAPLPGTSAAAISLGNAHPQSGACCPSGSCCASGSCCQSYSACVRVDEEDRAVMRFRGDPILGRDRSPSVAKRLWPIPV